MAAGPVRDAELGSLFRSLAGLPAVALAVSGGADSTALMLLIARWRAQGAPIAGPDMVLTVDHGLRPESAAEASTVGERAAALGLRHRTLRWQGSKPVAGRQEAARAARYRLLTEAVREEGLAALVTAHTEDDQAETVLMRLGRGSGIDGLSAMAPESQVHGIRLLRPLLGIAHSRLVATLIASDVAWIEDPSNADPAYERVRLRRLAPQLADAGLTPAAIATSAMRLRRARIALDWANAALIEQVLKVDASGYATIDRASWAAAPEELRLRTLQFAIGTAGDRSHPPQLGKLESTAQEIAARTSGGSTLQGAIVEVGEAVIRVFREPGRIGLPSLPLTPSGSIIWDSRFRVSASSSLQHCCQVRPLQPGEIAELTRRERIRRRVPLRAALAVPSIWRDDECLAVPALGLDHPAVACEFLPLAAAVHTNGQS